MSEPRVDLVRLSQGRDEMMEQGASVDTPGWLGGGALVESHDGGLSALPWLAEHEAWLQSTLRSRGAVLLRGFKPVSIEEFGEIATVVGGGQDPLPYENRSTPRQSLGGNIFTSTEYPPAETISLHNENSYSAEWPAAILFLCQQPAQTGGETPIADSRRVYSSIAPETRALFEAKGVTYVRNFGKLGLSWEETFQTKSRTDVESYCSRHSIDWQWKEDGGLRTRQTLPAMRRHPLTGEPVWFNQAHLFHISNLGPKGEYLRKVLGSEGVPRNALFGDGSEIPAEHLETVRAGYAAHTVLFEWQANDVIILDNMFWAHGRRPFSGARRVLVAMTRMMRDPQVRREQPPE